MSKKNKPESAPLDLHALGVGDVPFGPPTRLGLPQRRALGGAASGFAGGASASIAGGTMLATDQLTRLSAPVPESMGLKVYELTTPAQRTTHIVVTGLGAWPAGSVQVTVRDVDVVDGPPSIENGFALPLEKLPVAATHDDGLVVVVGRLGDAEIEVLAGHRGAVGSRAPALPLADWADAIRDDAALAAQLLDDAVGTSAWRQVEVAALAVRLGAPASVATEIARAVQVAAKNGELALGEVVDLATLSAERASRRLSIMVAGDVEPEGAPDPPPGATQARRNELQLWNGAVAVAEAREAVEAIDGLMARIDGPRVDDRRLEALDVTAATAVAALGTPPAGLASWLLVTAAGRYRRREGWGASLPWWLVVVTA